MITRRHIIALAAVFARTGVTNWDAARVADLVTKGTLVVFEE